MSAFPCTSCGACCRMVGRTLQALAEDPSRFGLVERQALLVFPFQTREDGACEKLGVDGRCTVYAIRPLVCRVDMMAMARRMPTRESWERNAAACNAMQAELGLPAKYRVVLPVLEEEPTRSAPHAQET